MRGRVLLLSLALALASCAPTHRATPTATPPASTLVTADRPIPSVTPGVVLTRRAADVCTPGWASRHRRSLTARQKTMVLEVYGLRADQKVAEYDHLISLELGGGNGVRNIWPELSTEDARHKDRLESRLARLVCAGNLSLTEAQDRIKTYWDDPLW